jgi:hypothetical protein
VYIVEARSHACLGGPGVDSRPEGRVHWLSVSLFLSLQVNAVMSH